MDLSNRFSRYWRARARRLKHEIAALYLAYRDPRTPWAARLVTLLVVGYALSPIDLIPDFIPLLGYLDDLLLLPLGIWLALKLIPPQVLADCRRQAAGQPLPANRLAAALIIAIWIGLIGLLLHWLLTYLIPG